MGISFSSLDFAYGESDFTLEAKVNETNSDLDVTKIEIQDKEIGPSGQCKIDCSGDKYTWFSAPTPDSMSIAYSVDFTLQDNQTNADLGPKKKEFMSQFGASMYGCMVYDIIEKNAQEIYLCHDGSTTINRKFDSKSWDYDTIAQYDAKNNTLKVFGNITGTTPNSNTNILNALLNTTNTTNTKTNASAFSELITDETRGTTLDFSVKPLDNWAYQNAMYDTSILGFGINNAVEMWPNEFGNLSMVYGMLAKDGKFMAKNVPFEQYVKFKMNDTELKYLDESKLLSKENVTIINGTEKAVKLIYDNPENQLKLVLYLLNHNNENYLMFFWSKNNLFNKYFPEFDRMINTVKWVD